MFYLIFQRRGPPGGKLAGAAFAAENAAAESQCPVPVGAGHTAVQGQFIDFFPEGFFQIIVQRIIGFSIPVSTHYRLLFIDKAI